MFSADGKQPRAGTVDRQLLDRKCDADEFPTSMVLSCNPKAYVYKEELKRTVSEGMASRPTPIILKLDDYACHKEKEFVQFCEENHIYISPTKGGLTPKEQVLDQAANGMVHQHVTNGNIMRMLAPDAPTDERGYPKPLSRVELAKLVDEGWGKVPL